MKTNLDAYDVVVVGGGAAGLSAALVFGRARRRVVVIDAGAPRNAPAAHMQGFLSRDGMSPADLLAEGRKEVTGYGVELVNDQVLGIEPGFVVRSGRRTNSDGSADPDGGRGRRRRARRSRGPPAVGPGSPALPLLPWVGSPRPAPRDVGRSPRFGAARPPCAAVVRRCRLLRPHL